MATSYAKLFGRLLNATSSTFSGTKLSLLKSAVKQENIFQCSQIQIRHRTSNKQRVKERQESGQKTKSFITRKEKDIEGIQEAIQDETKYLAAAPIDNVWVQKHYPPQKISIQNAINKHKDFAQPEMLDNMQGLLYLKLVLDMTTKKKTKMMPNFRHTVALPNVFPFGKPPNVIVICKTDEQMNLASNLGAHTFGTPAEIVKSVSTGIVSPKDFDHVLATPDCLSEITSLRAHFREKYPQRARGNMSFDIEGMWDLFYNGYTFETQLMTESLAMAQIPLGLIEMPTDDLIENFEAYIESICKLKSLALGPFIKSIKIVAPPSPEEFLLKVEDYVPGYKDEEFDSDEEDTVVS